MITLICTLKQDGEAAIDWFKINRDFRLIDKEPSNNICLFQENY